MNKESLTKQAAYLTMGKIIAFALMFFVPMVLVRVFTKAEFGLYKQIFLAGSIVSLFQLGLVESVYYFYPREKKKRSQLITQTILGLILFGVIFMMLFFILRTQISILLNNPKLYNLIPYLIILEFFLFVAVLWENLMIVEKNVKGAAMVIIISDAARAGLLIFLSIVFKSVSILLYGLIVFAFLRFLCFMIYTKSRYNLSLKNLRLNFFGEQIRYAWPLGLAAIFNLLIYTLHKYFVSFFYNPEMFAVYSVGCMSIPLVGTVFDSVYSVVKPEMARHQKANNHDKMLILFKNSARKLSIFIFPLWVFLIVVSKELIITLFTKQYIESLPIFLIYILLIPKLIVDSGMVIKSFGKTSYLLKTEFLVLMLNLVLSFILIKVFGMVGAVSSLVICLYILTFIQLNKSRKLLRVSFWGLLEWKKLLKILGAALVAGGITYALKFVIILPNIFKIGALFLIFSAAYLVVSLSLKSIDKEEIKSILIQLRSIIKK